MKKIIFMLALSTVCFQLAGLSQARVGLAGGVSIARMESEPEGDGKLGLFTSLVVDAPIGKSKFSFYPVFSYVQKGQTEPSPAGTLIDKQYIALRYMELSTNFLYNVGGDKGGTFFIGLGPAISFNLPSKRASFIDDLKTETDILFGPTPENDLRGVDYGANFIAGLRAKGGVFISVNYNMGLRDLATEGDPELKNRYIGIQLGFLLK